MLLCLLYLGFIHLLSGAEVCWIDFFAAYNFNFNKFYFEGITTIQLLSKIFLKA